jgi:D-beta-D-heptose 7-phosphate kinase/D-beta-D-heptose 1-phosphate adenosyltransferase
VCRSLGLDGLVVVDAWPRLTLVTAERVTQFASPVPEGADETAVIDFVTARLASALGAGHDLEEACRNASVPAVSAATSPTGETAGNEREEATRLTPHRKVCEPDEARRWLLRQKQAGRRVVFTNGCFDILHAGHVACLEEARRQGDLLVVGLNSDASVRLNKGPERPIISEQNRATLLAALACVDLVVLFDELTPELLVRHLEPEILVKGGDYANVPIAGADFVRSRGGGVVLIPLVEGLSTTRILEASRGHAN